MERLGLRRAQLERDFAAYRECLVPPRLGTQ